MGRSVKIIFGVLPPLEYSESPMDRWEYHFSSAAEPNRYEFLSYIETNKNGSHLKTNYIRPLLYAKKQATTHG